MRNFEVGDDVEYTGTYNIYSYNILINQYHIKSKFLTIGKIYKIIRSENESLVIMNDYGVEHKVFYALFKFPKIDGEKK